MRNHVKTLHAHLTTKVHRQTALWALFTALALFFFTFAATVGSQPMAATVLSH